MSRLAEAVFAATGGRPAPAPDPVALAPVEPPAPEGTPAQVDAVQEYLNRHDDTLRAAFPKSLDYEAFQAAVAATLPRVAGCSPASLRMALVTCARFGLMPDGYEAVIEVQGRKAVFVPRYQGYIRLMYRSGMVASVHYGLVHETDEWEVRPSAPAPDDFVLKTRPELSDEERGTALFAYAFVVGRDGARSQVVYVNRHKAAEIRDEWSYRYKLAEQTGRRDSWWHRHFDHMMLKTGIKALYASVPTSPEVLALAAADDAGERGEVQIIHAPDPGRAALVADAERAHRAAEGSQELVRLPVKRNAAGRRYRGKKQRGGLKARMR
ncbi:recombinase RecT [Streptomyces sp. NBC_01420]|uniref:recombinase RecT n=1 Tax=Streptomyces sp. NBC_01420 TaxID=2903858 RepID=UPI00324DD137